MSFIEQSERRGGLARRVFLFLGLGFLAFIVGGFFWATSTPGTSWEGPTGTPQDGQLQTRLEEHVLRMASTPRSLASATGIMRTQEYIELELLSLGYDVERQEVVPPANNLIVSIAATDAAAPTLIVGAHYDTVSDSPGADDNASGVAALLELGRLLKARDGLAVNNIELVFYANEEPPYFKTTAMGSYVHAQSIEDTNSVLGMISLETMGYFSEEPSSQNYPFPLSLRYPSTGNFIAFAGDTTSRDFLRQIVGEFRDYAKLPSVGGTMPSVVQGIDWSDHWAYSEAGIPAIMVTDTAIFRNPHYHRASDTPDTLDYRRLALVVEGLEKVLSSK
uniref:M28 family peptidase n=1 Tax=uncultured Erythrobacter sp. TaxID=263913 RepID=UPI002603D31A|nr:M28 family peptidase [uncultured Erythrobacter sp.]